MARYDGVSVDGAVGE